MEIRESTPNLTTREKWFGRETKICDRPQPKFKPGNVVKHKVINKKGAMVILDSEWGDQKHLSTYQYGMRTKDGKIEYYYEPELERISQNRR